MGVRENTAMGVRGNPNVCQGLCDFWPQISPSSGTVDGQGDDQLAVDSY